jgi:hypothetical protein
MLQEQKRREPRQGMGQKDRKWKGGRCAMAIASTAGDVKHARSASAERLQSFGEPSNPTRTKSTLPWREETRR